MENNKVEREREGSKINLPILDEINSNVVVREGGNKKNINGNDRGSEYNCVTIQRREHTKQVIKSDDGFIPEATDGDANSGDEQRLSVEGLLQERMERISFLERNKEVQDEQIREIQQQFSKAKTKHKEELYWLNLKLSKTQKEKNATEERMSELYKGLRETVEVGKSEGTAQVGPVTHPDPSDTTLLVSDLQGKVDRYKLAVRILESQISMLKTSCDEVAKTLRDEIADLIEDRSRMEVDMLNQLATLDNERREDNIDFEMKIQAKNKIIQYLQKNKMFNEQMTNDSNSDSNIFLYDSFELEKEIAGLRVAKKNTEAILRVERVQADETILRLEEANAKLELELESVEDNLAAMEVRSDTNDGVTELQQFHWDRELVVNMLERVANIWKQAEASIDNLEDVIDTLRPHHNDDSIADREQLLSTLESASLVHGQVKVSLFLIELKLRNQLSRLIHDKESMAVAEPTIDEELVQRMTAIQQEALSNLGATEKTLTEHIRQIEERVLHATREEDPKTGEDTTFLQKMQKERLRLEEEIARLKQSKTTGNLSDSVGNEISKQDFIQKNETTTSAEIEEPSSSPQPSLSPPSDGISQTLLDKLHTEALRVVKCFQIKNSIIKRLQAHLDMSTAREDALKKELKRVNKAQKQDEKKKKKKVCTSELQSKTNLETTSNTSLSKKFASKSDWSPLKIKPLQPSSREVKSKVMLQQPSST